MSDLYLSEIHHVTECYTISILATVDRVKRVKPHAEAASLQSPKHRRQYNTLSPLFHVLHGRLDYIASL